jgi:TATA-binding protein-associated factor Taf7
MTIEELEKEADRLLKEVEKAREIHNKALGEWSVAERKLREAKEEDRINKLVEERLAARQGVPH